MDESIECQQCGDTAVWTADDEHKCKCGWFLMKLASADPATDPCFYAVCLNCEQINSYFPLWTRGMISHCGECGAELYIAEDGHAWWASLH